MTDLVKQFEVLLSFPRGIVAWIRVVIASSRCCVDQFRLSNLDSQIQNLKIHIFLHET